MRILSRMALAFALLLVGTIAAAAFEKGEVWLGNYVYRTGQPPVRFTLFITKSGAGTFEGVMVEPNTLGDRAFPELLADITGTREGATFSFTKQYDGTAGQSHTVQYTGQFAAERRRANGTWRLPDSNGTFEMHRR
jgi:hypothetical protein